MLIMTTTRAFECGKYGDRYNFYYYIHFLHQSISATVDGTSDGGGGAMISVLRCSCAFLGTLPST